MTDFSRIAWHGTVPDFPDLYDVMHRDQSSDVALYQQLCIGCDTVLECGVGTGRIAIPLARAGFKVHGVDDSAQMLSEMATKLAKESAEVRERVVVHHADMRYLSLGRTYDIALIPYMGFNYLGTLEEQVECLRAIRKHLATASLLVLELVSMYAPWFHNDGALRLVRR